MFNASKKREWYGILQSKSAEVVVIYDGNLVKPGPGKIYLFNTARDAMLEYVEDIVKSKLVDLKGPPLRLAKKRYAQRWCEARQAFLTKSGFAATSEDAPQKARTRPDGGAADLAAMDLSETNAGDIDLLPEADDALPETDDAVLEADAQDDAFDFLKH